MVPSLTYYAQNPSCIANLKAIIVNGPTISGVISKFRRAPILDVLDSIRETKPVHESNIDSFNVCKNIRSQNVYATVFTLVLVI